MKKLFLLLTLFGSIACSAVPTFDLLGTVGTHSYYISQGAVKGPQIDSVVASFRSLAGGAVNAYAAAIDNSQENAAIVNLMMAYNAARYGVATAPADAWNDPRNAWFGLTDVITEGTFYWMNSQATAYRNWSVGEPNAFYPDEDYVEMLIMQGVALGSWNDWNGTLPLIIEVAPHQALAVATPTLMLHRTDRGIELFLSEPGTVERSTDGVHYQVLGSFHKLAVDKAPATENYYRLTAGNRLSKVYMLTFQPRRYKVYTLAGQLVDQTPNVSRYLGSAYLIL